MRIAKVAALITALIATTTVCCAQNSSVDKGAKPQPTVLFTDITNIRLNEHKSNFLPALLYRLPRKFWMDVSIGGTQRLETNVLSTTSASPDYVFRAQPIVTMGYDLQHKDRSSLACYSTYQVVKDVFSNHTSLTGPTDQVVGVGMFKRMQVTDFSFIQFDCQAREDWQSSGTRQANLLPAFYFSRLGKGKMPPIFGSIILQMVSSQPFEGATKELDPAYSIGLEKNLFGWSTQVSDTFITNYRHPPFRNDTPNNEQMILEFDASHAIKRLPLTSCILSIQSVWNWGGHGVPGISGYDLRLFSGLQYGFSKRALPK